ncbi:MAG TPA: hypothetical protein VLE03_12410 [Nitrospiraceae bacterium]|nr:hypothetical protein [Nitrospiraceae bacterium]
MLSFFGQALMTAFEFGIAALALYFVASTARDLWLSIRNRQ